MRIILFILIPLLFSPLEALSSGAFPIVEYSGVIGGNTVYTIRDRETLIDLAVDYAVGYNEITAANRDVDPWLPEKETEITIPTSWVLPESASEEIVINLPEMRLYYFFTISSSRYVRTYPIGVGREGFDTPAGEYFITAKVENPHWKVPESIRAESPELPEIVPPGPDNPLGGFWLQLSAQGYGIHGTNRPHGIGRRVSHGCIRLYPDDIKVLSSYVKKGTKVRIIDEPVKIGISGEKIYIEVHSADETGPELFRQAMNKLSRKRLLSRVNSQRIVQAINNAAGLPAVISE